MSPHQTEFEYESRRSREEQVLAIEAETPAAAWAHRQLAVLHAARAMRIAQRQRIGRPTREPLPLSRS